MAVSYAKMKLKLDISVNTFDFEYAGEKYQIEVLRYLPVSEKMDLIQIALQRSYQNDVCDEIALDVYFNLNLVYLYTNISFTDKQKEDPDKLYDQLQCSGLLDQIIAHMDQDEYKHLLDYLDKDRASIDANNRSAKGVLEGLINDLPEKMQQTVDILDANRDKFPEAERMAALANATGMNNGKVVPISQGQQD